MKYLIVLLMLCSTCLADERLDRLHEAVNKLRETPVVHDPILQKAAQDYVNYLAATNRRGHVADGKDPEYRVARAGFKGSIRGPIIRTSPTTTQFFLGEVLTFGPPDESIALRCWLESPGHKEALLERTYTRCAFAVAEGRSGLIWIGMLGKELVP